jgi:hypothetical protein
MLAARENRLEVLRTRRKGERKLNGIRSRKIRRAVAAAAAKDAPRLELARSLFSLSF